MSTKELIDRLTQTEARPRRAPAAGVTPEAKGPDQSGVETRIGAGVIRRRRVGGRDEEVRIETKPPVLERAPQRAPIETPKPDADADAPKAKPKRSKKGAEPEAVQALPVAAPVETGDATTAKAKAKPETEAPVAAPPAPPLAVAPPPAPRPEPVVAKAEPPPAPVAEPAVAAPTPPAPAPAAAPVHAHVSHTSVPAEGAVSAEAPTQSSQLVSGLPRANVRRVEPAGDAGRRSSARPSCGRLPATTRTIRRETSAVRARARTSVGGPPRPATTAPADSAKPERSAPR